MTAEHPQPGEGFGFTDREKLYDRVSDQRFWALVADDQTAIHEVAESTNNYGEFLFVTASRPMGDRRDLVTFWGAGFHESRERWLTDEWFWYQANIFPETLSRTVSKVEAEARIQERRQRIAPYVNQDRQSARGKLFEMLADLMDEDGAYTELEDLEDMGYLDEGLE